MIATYLNAGYVWLNKRGDSKAQVSSRRQGQDICFIVRGKYRMHEMQQSCRPDRDRYRTALPHAGVVWTIAYHFEEYDGGTGCSVGQMCRPMSSILITRCRGGSDVGVGRRASRIQAMRKDRGPLPLERVRPTDTPVTFTSARC